MIYKDFQGIKLSALGMGCMRLPCIDGDDAKIDETATKKMAQYAFDHGVNYFDTAWGYHDGNSETVMGKVLQEFPRDQFYLASKFPGYDLANFPKVQEILEKQLEKLMEEFQKGMEKEHLITKISGDVTAFPALVCPGAEIISSNPESTTAYIGLFVRDIYKMLEKSRNNRKHLLPVLKALSDSSKFEILQSLRISPKYNLEIAEELKLSPPTVSHHMSVLLGNGLVDVEKREGKVYYTLSKERLREMVDELEKTFSI